MKFQKGDLVLLQFLDHVFQPGGRTDPAPILLVGWLAEETDVHYLVATWITDNELIGHSTDVYCVLKHRNLKIRKLPKQWKLKARL